MEFVLVLHSHLPWVLGHGRWPHGSDWLCEAALDTYLPLLEALGGLEREGVPAPLTIGFTPVLANQLSSPGFVSELESFFEQRLRACDAAAAGLAAGRDGELLPLVAFWRGRFERLRRLFHEVECDLVKAFAALEERGRLEIIGSAATHGYLPLLARDESIRLQLIVGRQEHRRLFGREPRGCWVPECGYRPRGTWAPPGMGRRAVRRGIEEHLAETGFRFFMTDAHLAHAGTFLGAYQDVPLGVERFDAERHDPSTERELEMERSPYRAYRLPPMRRRAVSVLVRDPRTSMQVWSRHQGYPGDEWYLEFHKIRWPGGLKLWRVSAPGSDLGEKRPYQPEAAASRAEAHAEHFARLLGEVAAGERAGSGVIVAPFDTELFGHWWFEGVNWIASLYRRLAAGGPRPVTGGEHLRTHAPRTVLRLAAGSWGAGGDDRMWLNDLTRWMWRRLWPLEDAFWEAAPRALVSDGTRPILAQAARELLLAESSDWEFIVSTGAVVDYAERRFVGHCEDLESLLSGLGPGAPASAVEEARRRADLLCERNGLFPGILDAVQAALE
jgi:1,4-alpha-glucan branching enzyme